MSKYCRIIVKMLSNNDLKAVCTVTELAKKLDLSRARFYQLLKMGIFPKPAYCIRTRRPIYTLDFTTRVHRRSQDGNRPQWPADPFQRPAEKMS